MNTRNEIAKVPRLNEKDAETLSKALYYSKKTYEEVLLAKESSVHMENVINEFIKAQSLCNESNENSNGESKGHTKKKQFWYSQTITNACSELCFLKKDPSDKTMCKFIYNNLKKAHPENVSKIDNNTADNPKANKKAVCFSCIRKHTLPIAISKPECFVSNKALLCRNHLKKCENFAHEYHESEREEILSRKVPEDEKKNKTQAIINESEMETDKSTTAAPSNSIIKQSTLSGYVSRPFSKKDIPHFENLVLLMMVSNGLSFTFLENKETQEVFRFIAPALKLPG
ncbi:hypothetical protein RhiirB3_450486, partial [Rhizophagus irregularis]